MVPQLTTPDWLKPVNTTTIAPQGEQGGGGVYYVDSSPYYVAPSPYYVASSRMEVGFVVLSGLAGLFGAIGAVNPNPTAL